MYELVIETSGGDTRQVPLPSGRTIIGKGQQSDIRIEDALLSRRHCLVEIDDQRAEIEDMGSTNGTWIDGEAVTTRTPLQPGVAVRLGRHVFVRLRSPAEETVPSPASQSAPAERTPASGADGIQQLKQEIQRRILDFLDLRRRGSLDQMSADEIRKEARSAAEHLIDQGEIRVPAEIDRDALLTAVVSEAIGLGAIEPLIDDESVGEIMVNGPDRIYVEREGRVELSNNRFSSDAALMNVIDRIVTPVGRRIDEGNPMIDARLADGSRVNAIIPPLALTGPTLTIRKFAKERLRVDDLVRFGSLTQAMGQFLEVCVKYRRNIVVSGGTGSGKTTTLNVLSDFIPETERIVTIEDSAELQLAQDHIVSLESRPANVEGTGEVSIRDLVRNSLRMRPDRIVVGECRGGEALDMLQAMNTGHDGSLTTGHANSPRDMLSRLEVMVMMSGMELPSRAIREQIAAAVDIIVQITRLSDGRRLVTDIHEVGTLEGDVISLQQIFTYKRTGLDGNGMVTGFHTGTGYAPGFYQELRDAGLDLDWSIFRNLEESGEESVA
ncbi:MAG: ATPase, T2SS/T4P/T4SS family [Halofilum sp. (in: g-proteobacteria)]|nr:ATPase, T2SS/T4P/T4SS family [Halofilum sp. (in: g-proteobacteria)]